ncbi:MAG TPA: L,D-transpeptidase family protein [Puia sp.]|nr:L,D-transpeptidase family protein [Puia sp.]
MKYLVVILLVAAAFPTHAQQRPVLRYPALVRKFYDEKPPGLFWLGPDSNTRSLRAQLWAFIDSSRFFGLDSDRYHYPVIRGAGIDNATAVERLPAGVVDTLLTDALVSFCKDLHEGSGNYDQPGFDDYRVQSGEFNKLLMTELGTGAQLAAIVRSVEPRTAAYLACRRALQRELDSNDRVPEIKMLALSLDYYRWMAQFGFSKFIVVNIASANLSYYDGDSLRLKMKVVAGKPSTPTPRFAARCTEVVLYPYWNVPRRIAIKEFRPLFKANPSMVNELGMQIVDAHEKVLDPQLLAWPQFSGENFPYRLRQVTGCDNALGVIKFELTDPYGVYMHDTNLKSAFASSRRYYSHGCIRLEKPFLLAKTIVGDQLDTMFLTECRKDQQPRRIALRHAVPVLVVYMTAEADASGRITWYKDPYHLLANK